MSSYIHGPWLIAGDGRFVYALNDRGFNAFSAHIQDAHTNDEDLQATATLIHAAPDLLEALEGLLSDTQHAEHLCGDMDCPVRMAISAVAKAKGLIA